MLHLAEGLICSRIHRFLVTNEGTGGSEFCVFGVLTIQQTQENSMSLTKKLRGFYISCRQELFAYMERDYGVLPKRFRKLLLWFELVCVWRNICPAPSLVRWDARLHTRFALHGRFWPR